MATGLARSRHGQAVDLALDRAAQQPVPGRVELDLVDPVAEAVVGAQDREVALGPAASARASSTLPATAPASRARSTPHSPPSRYERLAQREVDLEQVDRLERRRLVEDLARRVGARRLSGWVVSIVAIASPRLSQSWSRVVNLDSQA